LRCIALRCIQLRGVAQLTNRHSTPALESLSVKQKNHNYIDVLKMDIEGIEYDWLHEESQALFPHIGQFLVELHVHLPDRHVALKYPGENGFSFLEKCEEYGQRLFNEERNKFHTAYHTELGFNRNDWTVWDSEKKFSLNVPV
jgi:hypothetical protein